MNKNLLMIGILMALVLVSAVQAAQLVNIKSDMKDLGVGTTIKKTTPTSNVKATSGSSNTPTNLQNLPGMVGGC